MNLPALVVSMVCIGNAFYLPNPLATVIAAMGGALLILSIDELFRGDSK